MGRTLKNFSLENELIDLHNIAIDEQITIQLKETTLKDEIEHYSEGFNQKLINDFCIEEINNYEKNLKGLEKLNYKLIKFRNKLQAFNESDEPGKFELWLKKIEPMLHENIDKFVVKYTSENFVNKANFITIRIAIIVIGIIFFGVVL